MTNLREAAQMALDALEFETDYDTSITLKKAAIEMLRAALAQPEQATTNNGRYLTGYKAQPEPPCKTGSQCVGGKCERCAVQPEQEPVAWMHTTATGDIYFRKKPHDEVYNPRPVYLVPPQREWQGLTDEEIEKIYLGSFDEGQFARAIEAKLKEKNA